MTLPSRTAPIWLLVTLQGLVSAASLVVEIVAGRMIAPYVGMSLYTWTAIIAVVLAGFSAGHWWGGRIAERDTRQALRRTGWAIVGAAVTTGGAALILRQVAGPVLEALNDPLSAITVLSALVFFLPSLFAGVPAPVLSVVAIREGGRSGHALGAMFAAGALGAIAGTLLAGFLFISWLGTAWTLACVTACYGAVALVLFRLAGSRGGAALAVLAGAVGLAGWGLALPRICDRESQYFCIRTVELTPERPGALRLMVLDHLAHGISERDDPTRMHTEHGAMLDAIARMRMGRADFSAFFIGGGNYAVPRAWAARGIGTVTVSEIDPEVTRMAMRDFWFDPATANVLHEDARRALARRPEARFDVVVGDAFTDIAVPAHLVTREFFDLIRARLAPDGVYLMNVIDHVDRMEALLALVATLQAVFPQVEVWTEARPPEPGERRIFVLVAGASQSPVSALVAGTPDPTRFAPLDAGFIAGLVARRNPVILSDDYAPIDRLVGLGNLLK